MNQAVDLKTHKFARVIRKVILAAIIGLGFFFGGLFCAVISPLIAVLSLLYTPSVTISDKVKSWEESFKELQDPDYKEKWKKDHDDLYNEDQDKNK